MTDDCWRLLPFDVGRSDIHFAQSDALARHSVVPTVWWHAANRTTLILGVGQDESDIDQDTLRRHAIRVVRRQAGGTAVLATRHVLGLDVFVPAEHRLFQTDVVETYRWLGRIWQDGLEQIGIASRLAEIAESRAASVAIHRLDPIRRACFGTLSPYEVMIGTRKLVGLAQVRRRAGILIQAGIHLRFDPLLLASVLGLSVDAEAVAADLSRAAIGLDEASGTDIAAAEVMAAVNAALEEITGMALVTGALTDAEECHTRTFAI